MLYRHLRIHQIFAASTDVGKTLIATAITRTRKNTRYLKPVSTGPWGDTDERHLREYAGINATTLYQFDEPKSPHLSAADGKKPVPSAEEVYARIREFVDVISKDREINGLYIETAGGVHSPTLNGTSQADFYRPFRFPVIFVADFRLGGISTSLASYEALLIRGYDIDAVMCLEEGYYKNHEYFRDYFGERGIAFHTMCMPPEKGSPKDEELMHTYYHMNNTDSLVDTLESRHKNRISKLDSMPRRTAKSVWWPFTQHGLVAEKEINVIDSAVGDFFIVYDGNQGSQEPPQSLLHPEFDASASWWTQALGHSHPELSLAAASAAGRYGHVLFPSCTNEPALTLSERLINGPIGRGWASRCFFSDDGSTGMEVALKMAIRASNLRYNLNGKNIAILGLSGSYHGDTIGAMDACEGGVFNAAVEWHEEKGYWFNAPQIMIKCGKVHVGKKIYKSLDEVFDMDERLSSEEYKQYCADIEDTIRNLRANGREFGALVLEPVVMGAGGMIFVDPLYQRALVDVVRSKPLLFANTNSNSTPEEIQEESSWKGLPVIFDQVFVGMHRLGKMNAAEFLGVHPDITVLAKILTGGVVPGAVTLASNSIFNTFYGDKKVTALLHGHSYTAHPVGCTVANKTLDIIEMMEKRGEWDGFKSVWGKRVWSIWDKSFVDTLSREESKIEGVMAMGTVLAIYLKAGDAGYQSTAAASLLNYLSQSKVLCKSSPGGLSYNIHGRPLGNVVYFMTSLNTPLAVVESTQTAILEGLQNMR